MADATPADIFAALFAGHQIGDHWAQTSRQAQDKGLPGGEGRLACARHVASLTACKAVSLAALHATGRRVSPRRAIVALGADALSHYLADRRSVNPPAGLPRLAFALGKRDFWLMGASTGCLETGGHVLDQVAHIACLYAAALIAAGRESGA